MIARRGTQLSLARRHGWGGARPGAGRKRKDGTTGPSGVPHRRRPRLESRQPVGVTLKVRSGVANLRSRPSVDALRAALGKGHQRPGFRLVHFSILSNHLHLIVEASDRLALSRGMQALEVRIARALNREQQRTGPVFADRFHAHVLATPAEVANARRYVLENRDLHRARAGLPPLGPDPLTSERIEGCTAPPRTWLLSVGWNRRAAARRTGPPLLMLFRDTGT
jgi:REP element-mobilizing transposase RayT